MAIVAAHLLIVRAVVVLCPQRNDDVTGLRARRAREFGIGQRAERQRGGAGLRVGVFPGTFAHLDKEDDEEEDEHEEDDAAGCDGGKQSHFGA